MTLGTILSGPNLRAYLLRQPHPMAAVEAMTSSVVTLATMLRIHNPQLTNNQCFELAADFTFDKLVVVDPQLKHLRDEIQRELDERRVAEANEDADAGG